jgi:uncharacterized protein YraI
MEFPMKMRSLLAALAFLGAAAAPGLAAAYTTAYSAPGTSNMRAGPGTDYPVIARVLGGSQVNVVGCLASRSWCDVIVQNYRGWMSTSRLEFLYGGARVYYPQYYAYFDVPVIGFDFGYWDRHYSHWPWYRDRYRWRHDDDDDDGGWDGGTPDRTPYECLLTENCGGASPGWDGGGVGGWDGGSGGGGGGGGGGVITEGDGWSGGSGGGGVTEGSGGSGGGGGDGGWSGGTGGGVVGSEGAWGGGGVCPPGYPC